MFAFVLVAADMAADSTNLSIREIAKISMDVDKNYSAISPQPNAYGATKLNISGITYF